MSPLGALTAGLSALIVLGAVAAWLVNVPPLAIGALVLVATWLARALVRRAAGKTSRQKTEA